jgi:hypothetical protein
MPHADVGKPNGTALLLDSRGRELPPLPVDEAPAEGDAPLLVLGRLATNKDVDVEKLKQLIDMQERITGHQARAEFNAAYAAMQGDIPIITERGEIAVNGQVRSKYAKFEDILRVVKPILQRHGFALRHSNKFVDGKLTVTGILSHRSGHSEQDEFVTDPDTGPGRNTIQSLGSARSYGQRYTTIALLNIATSGEDDDGRATSNKGAPAPPAGYDEWWLDMEGVAHEGFPRLEAAWNRSAGAFKNYVTKNNRDAWEALKTKALRVRS